MAPFSILIPKHPWVSSDSVIFQNELQKGKTITSEARPLPTVMFLLSGVREAGLLKMEGWDDFDVASRSNKQLILKKKIATFSHTWVCVDGNHHGINVRWQFPEAFIAFCS